MKAWYYHNKGEFIGWLRDVLGKRQYLPNGGTITEKGWEWPVIRSAGRFLHFSSLADSLKRCLVDKRFYQFYICHEGFDE